MRNKSEEIFTNPYYSQPGGYPNFRLSKEWVPNFITHLSPAFLTELEHLSFLKSGDSIRAPIKCPVSGNQIKDWGKVGVKTEG